MNSITLKLNKLHYILLYLTLFLWLFIRSYSDLSFFRYTHYLFNYEHEFLKRGFIGEILRLSFENVNFELVRLISVISLIVLSVIIFNIFVTSFNKKPDASKLIFSIMAFVSPMTIQHFIHDIGRFDIINLIITLLCFFIIEKFYKKTLLIFVLIGSLIALLLLIHEGTFFMFVPMIFGYWFFKNSDKSTIAAQVALFGLITFLTFKISTVGLATKYTLDEYYILLSSKQLEASKWAMQLLYRGLFENSDDGVPNTILKLAVLIGLSKSWLIHNFILLFCLSPLFYITFFIFKDFFYKSTIQTKILLISGLSPLCLFFLGADHMRWWALTFTNIFIIFFKLSKESNFYFEIIKKNVIKYKILYIFLIIEAFILGPARVYQSFDIFVNLLGPSKFPLK